MNLWKKIYLTILVTSTAAIGIFIFLVTTTIGLRLIFNLTNRWIPGLEIGLIRGNWQNLYLQNIHYRHSGIAIYTNELHLKLKLSSLLKSGLHIKYLSLKNINIAIDSNKTLELEHQLKQININNNTIHIGFPISCPIILNRLLIKNIKFKINNTTISAKNLLSGFYFQNKNLIFMPTILRGLLIVFPKTVEITHQKILDQKPDNLQHKWKTLNHTLKNFISKPILSKISKINFPINLNISEFKGEDLHLIGDNDLEIYNFLLKFNINNNYVHLNTLDINSNYGAVNIIGTAQLSNNWLINILLNGSINIDSLKKEQIQLQMIGVLYDKLNIFGNFCGPLSMRLRAQIQLALIGLPIDLEINSNQFYWPFNKKKCFQVEKLILKFTGKITDYVLSLRMTLKGQWAPPVNINLYANGNEHQMNFDKLTIGVLKSKIQFIALLNWRNVTRWNGAFKLIWGNNVKSYYPFKLNGLMKIYGKYSNNRSWDVIIPELKIIGNVKNNKINVNGSLKGNSQIQWFTPGVYLRIGSNNIILKGKFNVQEFNLDTIVDAPKLNETLFKINDIIRSQVKIFSVFKKLRLLANITISNLYWRDHFVKHIRTVGYIKHNNQIDRQLNTFIKYNAECKNNIKSGILEIIGNEQHHVLQLNIKGKRFSGKMYLFGNFDHRTGNWNGTIRNINVNTPFGRWVLTKVIKLNYRKKEQKISISSHIWNNQNAEFYIPQSIDLGEKSRLAVNFKLFNLEMLKKIIPNTIKVNGILNGKIYVIWNITKERLPQVNISLFTNNMKIIKETTNIPLVMNFDFLNLKLQLHDNHANIAWLIRLTNNGQFNGQIEIENKQNRLHNMKGSVHIHNFNLGIMNKISSYIKQATGIINADIQLVGNIAVPQLYGYMHIKDINIDNNAISFNMQPSKFIIHFNGKHLKFLGAMSSCQGKMNIFGDADWSRQDNWYMRLIINGNRIRISIPSIIDLEISPDIIFKLTPNFNILTGRIYIPWGCIVMHELPESAVAVSNDEVIIKENLKSTKINNIGIPINSNLIVHLGNDVRIDVFGLKSKVAGDLKVTYSKQSFGFNGQIKMLEGRFRAYGQDLIMRKGELLFSGPLDQSVINLEAIRNPELTEDNVISGVRVISSPDESKVEIFSDPIMSQQEALSYLIRGHGIANNQSDSTIITSMLISLGITQSSKLVSKIGEMFGVSNLVLNTQGVGDSSKVVVSGYVFPNLQVKYGVGIFNALAMFTVRYRIMSNLYLEAVSSINHTLDLLYQFEF